MGHLLVLTFTTINFYLFEIGLSAPSINSTFYDLVSSNLTVPNYYEKYAMDAMDTLERLRGNRYSQRNTSRKEEQFFFYFYCSISIETKYCESILSPTRHTLRKSLYETFISGGYATDLDDDDVRIYNVQVHPTIHIRDSTINIFNWW